MEMKGDVQDSLPTSMDESGSMPTQDDANMRVFYFVHPSVDTGVSSSFT